METRKIGLMGGTFNPIHKGHLMLAEAALHSCNLDEIWFIPSGISYMKDQKDIVSADHRLSMVEAAIGPYPHFKVTNMEIKRRGNTYTAVTLRILSEIYPEYQFYFIMGADSLFALPTWKEPETIMRLSVIIAVLRDDVEKDALILQKEYLEKTYHGTILLIPFEKVDISSTQIRENIHDKALLERMLPSAVVDYIYANELYGADNMKLEKLRSEMKKVQDSSRYEHTLGVAYTAASLATIYGVEVKSALTAGMLHDCAKCYSGEKKLSLCKKYGLPVSPMEERNPSLVHAKLGAKVAADKYNIKNTDILNAITYHTTGRPGMSMLEKIIFVADYIEPGRDKAPDLLEVRKLAYTDIDKCIVKILSDTLMYLKKNGSEIDPATEETLLFYVEQMDEKRA